MTIKEKILKIMSLALEINPPEIEDVGEKMTAVFVRYSPHCSLFEVDVHLGGWKAYLEPDDRFNVHVSCKSADYRLDAIIARLESIKADIGEAGAMAEQWGENNGA